MDKGGMSSTKSWGKNILGRGNSKYKCPGAGTCYVRT